MAINPKALASWGLLGEAGGSYTQVTRRWRLTRGGQREPLAVELSAAEISVELSDDQ